MIELHYDSDYDSDQDLLSWSIESNNINKGWAETHWIKLYGIECLCGKPTLILTYEDL